jgi:hypothetical protein
MSSIHDSFEFIKRIAELETLDDSLIAEAQKLVTDHPYDYVDFSGGAIREHYENWGENNEVTGLSDQDLQDAGEWALNWDLFWDSVYDAWEYGIAQIRSEKQKEVPGT